MEDVGGTKKRSSYWLFCATKCFQKPSTTEFMEHDEKHNKEFSSDSNISPKKPGWRAMPYILGNETFERLATFGLSANFMVYFMKVFHMNQVTAAQIMNIWTGITNFAPLFGAFISDTYAGRFKTIAFASCSAILGMVTVTITAWLPFLHPHNCDKSNLNIKCNPNPTNAQIGVLALGLGFLSIATGGIRPCSIPFGVDQFDSTTEEGRKGINSFYNWYYTTFTLVILITLTVVVYIQDSVSWVIGFGIPTVAMFCSILLFFVGFKIYVHVKPEGSIFSGIARVFVAAYHKRRLELPNSDDSVEAGGLYYDPPVKGNVLSKLSLTNEFRFLNKAALVEEKDPSSDGELVDPWRLCTIQQVEEVKCLLRMGPIWASGMISLTAMSQQWTFTVSQAMKMDRHLGPNFQIPPGSISVISMITIGIWLPFYDGILVPALRKITGHEGGITILQRIGVGIIFSILAMVVAGLVEMDRRISANSHPTAKPMSVLWLAPQLVMLGFCEAFSIIGQIEFYNRQFPEHMISIGNALFFTSFGCASYVSSLLVAVIHKTTGTKTHKDWLADDLNQGKLDYFYFLIAGIGVLNLFYFLFIASRYRYKESDPVMGEKGFNEVELSPTKNHVSPIK